MKLASATNPDRKSGIAKWRDLRFNAMERRIVVGQALYAFGACLCFFNTYLSIAFIVLVQINFALAPRLPYLSEV
jgi:hypothetical protein